MTGATPGGGRWELHLFDSFVLHLQSLPVVFTVQAVDKITGTSAPSPVGRLSAAPPQHFRINIREIKEISDNWRQ